MRIQRLATGSFRVADGVRRRLPLTVSLGQEENGYEVRTSASRKILNYFDEIKEKEVEHASKATYGDMIVELEGIKAELRMLYLERSKRNEYHSDQGGDDLNEKQAVEALEQCSQQLGLSKAEAVENYNYATNLQSELKKLQDWLSSTTQAPPAMCPPCAVTKVRNGSAQQDTFLFIPFFPPFFQTFLPPPSEIINRSLFTPFILQTDFLVPDTHAWIQKVEVGSNACGSPSSTELAKP